MSSYQHSQGFARLKDTKETIHQNYTTYQWLTPLDFFIESAIDPIATSYPDFMDNYFAKVVAWQTTRPSVKFSRNKKETLPAALFNSVTTNNAEKRFHQKSMMLNRGVLMGLVSSYLQTVNSYMKLHDPTCKVPKRRRRMLCALAEQRCGSSYLYSATLQTQYWAAKAYQFKELIIQKYIRLALMSAKRTYADVHYEIALDDIIQTYLVYLSKAIDRCDARQGVLTTFIQTWFYSARAETKKSLYEEAHSSYEELRDGGQLANAVQPTGEFEALQHIASVAKGLDKTGVLRYAIGIPEFFTSSELTILSTHKL